MNKVKVKALINIIRDDKLIKIGETFEVEESEVERMVRHEAIDIIEGPVETENKEVDKSLISNENLDGGNIDPLDNQKLDGGNIDSLDKENIADGNSEGNIKPLDDGNIDGGDSGDDITLEEIQEMTIPEIKKLAEDNNIELKGKLKDELAQELFDKLGEE